VHAYQSIGVQVAVHGATATRSTPTAFPLILNAPVTNAFTQYSADGSRQRQGSDLEDDGSPEIEYAWTYDALGRTRKTSLHTSPTLGLFNSSHDGEYQYDARGAVTGFVDSIDNLSDGEIDFTNRDVVENDAWGLQLVATSDQVQGMNGALMSHSVTRSYYDGRHNHVSSTTETDSDGDGVIDARSSYSTPVDAQERQSQIVLETDDNADGVIDSRTMTKTDYRTDGTHVTVEENDSNADGTIDSRSVTTELYDRAGWLVWQEFAGDFDNDGVVDTRFRLDLEYDAEHRVIGERQSRDFDGNGVSENLSTRVSTFDSSGSLLMTTLSYDYSSDSVIDYQQTESHEYGTSGELLSGATHTSPSPSLPLQPAFAIDATSVTTNEVFADGVQLLAQEYLEPTYGGYVSL
jgi:hypothetical protein